MKLDWKKKKVKRTRSEKRKKNESTIGSRSRRFQVISSDSVRSTRLATFQWSTRRHHNSTNDKIPLPSSIPSSIQVDRELSSTLPRRAGSGDHRLRRGELIGMRGAYNLKAQEKNTQRAKKKKTRSFWNKLCALVTQIRNNVDTQTPRWSDAVEKRLGRLRDVFVEIFFMITMTTTVF